MDDRTRAATHRDVLEVAKLLEREGVEYRPHRRLCARAPRTDLKPYVKRIDGINVVSLEGLLRMKQNGRLKDQADAEAIRKVLESR